MKQKIITLMVAAAALCAMPAATYAKGNNDAQGQKTECTQGQKCHKQGHKADRSKSCQAGDTARCNKGKAKCAAAFNGIELSEQQKTAIEALRPARPQGCKEANKEAKDTVRPDRKKLRSDYVRGVKQVLTPEQYVVFLENIVIDQTPIPGNQQPKAHKAPKAKMAHKHANKDKNSEIKSK